MKNRNSKICFEHTSSPLSQDIFGRQQPVVPGFTLAELMIVVAIIGILAAIVIPEFQDHTQYAKESAAKDILRTLRMAIERYAIEHDDIPPGYPSNDPSMNPSSLAVVFQLRGGGYIFDLPRNPFNQYDSIKVVLDAESFPETPNGNNGFIYKPKTREFRLDWPGTDSKGVPYFEY